eukprot:gene2362-biopygen1316
MEAPTIVGDRSVYHDCWWKRLPAAGKIRRSAAGRRRKARRKSSDGSVGAPSEGSVGMVRRKVRRKSSGGSVGRQVFPTPWIAERRGNKRR